MKNDFPSSPIPNHAFLPFPKSGLLYDETGEGSWIVIVQRDLTIRGPRPALCYVPVQRGIPTDVIGYHLMNEKQASAIADRQMTDILRIAPRLKRDLTIGALLATSMFALLTTAIMRRA